MHVTASQAFGMPGILFTLDLKTMKYVMINKEQKRIVNICNRRTTEELAPGYEILTVQDDFPMFYILEDKETGQTAEMTISYDEFIKRRNENYIAKRVAEYPAVEEQLDMLWHGMNEEKVGRIEPFYSAIKKIKQDNPKE